MADSNDKKLDAQTAHRQFSAQCFNKTWDFIDKVDRKPEDEEEMLRLAMTSHWHWTQREDYAPDKASVANWQIARVFALLGQADNARRYGRRSLEVIESEAAQEFFKGYAHEALARAEAVAGNAAAMEQHLDEARRLAKAVSDADSKEFLLADLATIKLAHQD